MATALVTGANRGIGLSICRALLARGDRVIGTARSGAPELDHLDVRVEPLEVTSDASVAELDRRLTDVRLDLLVANAGILRRDGLDSLDVEAIREQFEVNALGALRVVSALRHRIGPGGKVALVTSRMGSIGDNTSGGYYGYRMSKAALNAAGVSLAHDLRPHGVAVVILHPGMVRTEMTGGHGDRTGDEAASRLLARVDELRLETTGRFLHVDGQELPW